MLDIQNIFLAFDKNSALENIVFENITLKIKSGQFVTVIGTNGSGKSTLLKVISGKINPDEGRIILDGKDITKQSEQKRAKMITQVFQDPLAGTCPDLTLSENMALAQSRGQKRGLQFAINSTNKKIFQEKLSLLNLGLENRMEEKIKRFSGGQRQTITLLMASLQPAKIWLLDEHTSALDPRIAEKALFLTKSLIEDKGITAIMVTHSMKQALNYGSRTIMLNEGGVILDISGKERDEITPDNLIEQFAKLSGTKVDEDKLLIG